MKAMMISGGLSVLLLALLPVSVHADALTEMAKATKLEKEDPAAARAIYVKIAQDENMDSEVRAQAFVKLSMAVRTASPRRAFQLAAKAYELGQEGATLNTATTCVVSPSGVSDPHIIIETLKPLVDLKGKSPTRRWSVVNRLASAYVAAGDPQSALELLGAEQTRHKGAARFAVVVALAGVHEKLGSPDKAIEILNEGISSVSDAPQADRFRARQKIAGLYQEQLGNTAAAINAYQDAIASVKDGFDATTGTLLLSVNESLAELYVEAGDQEKAIALILGALRDHANARASVALNKQLLACSPNQSDIANAITLYRDSIAESPATQTVADTAHSRIIELLLHQGDSTKALQEARVLFLTCDKTKITAAIDYITSAYKAEDFNLMRANRFLRYQRFGPAGEDEQLGTKDDLVDILAQLPVQSDPERAKPYRRALAKLPDDWKGLQAKAQIYLYLEQPEMAFEALRRSFLKAPVDEKSMQEAVDALTGFVVRMTKDADAAETLAKFIMFGAPGEDGVDGTADDLVNPTGRIKKQLAFGATKSVPRTKAAKRPAAVRQPVRNATTTTTAGSAAVARPRSAKPTAAQ